MTDWQPIETAPQDGTEVETGKPGLLGIVHHPLRARFANGHWEADFGHSGWGSFDPQPTVWRPA